MDLEQRRHEVVRQLHAAAGDGRLDSSIALDRIARAGRAESADELDVLVSGLAAPAAPAPIPTYPVAEPASMTADPGSSEASPITYRTKWRALIRQGPWRVPAYLMIDSGYGKVLLDFVGAVVDSATVSIELVEANGWVLIVVPRGWGVNTDRVVRSFGYLNNRVASAGEPGSPQIVIHGSLGYAWLSIRYQKPRDERRLAKFLAASRPEIEA